MEDAKPNSPEDAGFTHRQDRTGNGTCTSCKAPIYWAEINGRPHPVNRQLADDGRIILWKRPDGSLHGRILRKGEPVPAGHLTRKSHFATCPQAKQHRKGGRRG